MRFSRLPLVLIFHLSLQALVKATCYMPNGKLRQSKEYQPCNQNTVSMCCATNRTNPPSGSSAFGYTQDTCLPNGLCESVVTIGGVLMTSYFRESCSSPDFKSAGCLNVCVSGAVCIKSWPISFSLIISGVRDRD
jgi:hypothetical protein